MSRSGALARISLACAVAALAAAPAGFAGDSRWYVDGKLGGASFDATLGSRYVKQFDDDGGPAAGFEVGYRAHRFLAVQAGYQDFGEFDGLGLPCPDSFDTCLPLLQPAAGLCELGVPCVVPLSPMTAELSGASLSVLPQWPVGDRFTLFGRLGRLAWDADLSVHESWQQGRLERFSGEATLTGVGLRYALPRGLGWVAEYQRIDLDLGLASAGLSWRF